MQSRRQQFALVSVQCVALDRRMAELHFASEAAATVAIAVVDDAATAMDLAAAVAVAMQSVILLPMTGILTAQMQASLASPHRCALERFRHLFDPSLDSRDLVAKLID